MDSLVELNERPVADEVYMIAGWRQWADGGAISSGLPEYLVSHTGARKIGQIKPEGFYLFQIPGAHHFLRPEIKLEGGYRKSLAFKRNEFFYSVNNKKGLVIFLGDEPHLNVERYAGALFDVANELHVRRIVALGGVYGAMPYDKDRQISSTYSLPKMKEELSHYALRFSDYEGGASVGTYLAGEAEQRGLEFFTMYGFVPAYDLSQLSSVLQGMAIENDYKAWYDIMRRLNHMFGLGIDLSGLGRQADEVRQLMDDKVRELQKMLPQQEVTKFFDELNKEFVETPFMPLGDVWERELGDLLTDLDDK